MKTIKMMIPIVLSTALYWGCGSEDEKEGSQDAGDSSGDAGAEKDASPDDAGASTDDTDDTIPDYDFSAFEAEAEAFVSGEPAVEGMGAIIVHKDYGVVYRNAFGVFEEDRDYLIASSSKILTAGIIMTLVDAGKIDLDAPISEYVGDWGDFETTITTADLVSNSSGLMGLVDSAGEVYDGHICQFITSFTLTGCAQAIYGTIPSEDTVPPRTEYRYGGGQWQLAGGLAEVVSDKSWATLIKENYVDKCDLGVLGYTNPFMAANEEAGDSGTMGYPSFFAGDAANAEVTENPSMEGGAYTDIDDYGQILLMHLRGGLCGDNRVLSEEAVMEMRKDRAAVYGGTGSEILGGYGMGWWIDLNNPGVYVDEGMYGAEPWIDVNRGYGAFLVLEAGSELGKELRSRVQSLIDQAFDDAAE